MIAVIDYDTGNLRSVENVFKRVGAEYIITSNPQIITSADHVFLPGVGSAGVAMERLKERQLVDVIKSLKVPTLGICLGMQLMCEYSEEDQTECLAIFPNRVTKFAPNSDIKVPHMGWNTIFDLKSPLYKGLDENSYVYFVHSFAADLNSSVIATSNHGINFGASLNINNFYGCQFHPEKSGDNGERIIQNFLSL